MPGVELPDIMVFDKTDPGPVTSTQLPLPPPAPIMVNVLITAPPLAMVRLLLLLASLPIRIPRVPPDPADDIPLVSSDPGPVTRIAALPPLMLIP